MKDQHTKIKGYRDLSQVEIDLMNAIKGKAEEVKELINLVQEHLSKQDNAAYDGHSYLMEDTPEQQRLMGAEAYKWRCDAESDLQVGFMKLVRSVAQPTSF
jgi:hypothetical protein